MQVLIERYSTLRSLRKRELIRAIGYKNETKGLRRLDLIYKHQVKPDRFFIEGLSRALGVDVQIIERSIQADNEMSLRKDRLKHREAFLPHAVILTENQVPRPIIAAALVHADQLRRIDFDPASSPLTFPAQVLSRLPEGVPCFGRTVGFVINYASGNATQFDRDGNPVAVMNEVYRSSDIRLCLY